MSKGRFPPKGNLHPVHDFTYIEFHSMIERSLPSDSFPKTSRTQATAVRGVALFAKGLQSAYGTFEFRTAGAGGLKVSQLMSGSMFYMLLRVLMYCLVSSCCWQSFSCCLFSFFIVLILLSVTS